MFTENSTREHAQNQPPSHLERVIEQQQWHWRLRQFPDETAATLWRAVTASLVVFQKEERGHDK
jgi:hypothetical protein